MWRERTPWQKEENGRRGAESAQTRVGSSAKAHAAERRGDAPCLTRIPTNDDGRARRRREQKKKKKMKMKAGGENEEGDRGAAGWREAKPMDRRRYALLSNGAAVINAGAVWKPAQQDGKWARIGRRGRRRDDASLATRHRQKRRRVVKSARRKMTRAHTSEAGETRTAMERTVEEGSNERLWERMREGGVDGVFPIRWR